MGTTKREENTPMPRKSKSSHCKGKVNIPEPSLETSLILSGRHSHVLPPKVRRGGKEIVNERKELSKETKIPRITVPKVKKKAEHISNDIEAKEGVQTKKSLRPKVETDMETKKGYLQKEIVGSQLEEVRRRFLISNRENGHSGKPNKKSKRYTQDLLEGKVTAKRIVANVTSSKETVHKVCPATLNRSKSQKFPEEVEVTGKNNFISKLPRVSNSSKLNTKKQSANERQYVKEKRTKIPKLVDEKYKNVKERNENSPTRICNEKLNAPVKKDRTIKQSKKNASLQPEKQSECKKSRREVTDRRKYSTGERLRTPSTKLCNATDNMNYDSRKESCHSIKCKGIPLPLNVGQHANVVFGSSLGDAKLQERCGLRKARSKRSKLSHAHGSLQSKKGPDYQTPDNLHSLQSEMRGIHSQESVDDARHKHSVASRLASNQIVDTHQSNKSLNATSKASSKINERDKAFYSDKLDLKGFKLSDPKNPPEIQNPWSTADLDPSHVLPVTGIPKTNSFTNCQRYDDTEPRNDRDPKPMKMEKEDKQSSELTINPSFSDLDSESGFEYVMMREVYQNSINEDEGMKLGQWIQLNKDTANGNNFYQYSISYTGSACLLNGRPSDIYLDTHSKARHMQSSQSINIKEVMPVRKQNSNRLRKALRSREDISGKHKYSLYTQDGNMIQLSMLKEKSSLIVSTNRSVIARCSDVLSNTVSCKMLKKRMLQQNLSKKIYAECWRKVSSSVKLFSDVKVNILNVYKRRINAWNMLHAAVLFERTRNNMYNDSNYNANNISC